MYKAAIFDLDGTLADTMPDLATAMNSMLRDFGFKERTKEELLQFINHGARVFVGRSLPENVQDDENLVTEALKIYSDYYSKCYADKTVPFDGIHEVLASLRKSGIKLGVLSNKQDVFVKVIISKLFGEIDFVSVYGQTDVPTKPDPAGCMRILGEMGIDNPRECAFVGDSDIDMKTAANSGMDAIGVSWGYRSEDVLTQNGAFKIAHNAEELIKILTQK